MPTKHQMEYEDLETLIDTYPGGMCLTNLEGHVYAINDYFTHVLNISREELVGKKGWHLIEKFSSEIRKKEFQKAIENKKSVEFVDYERGRWWKTTATPIVNEHIQEIKLAVFVNDISSEMKNEEKKLLNQEHYFLSLIENTMDIITVIDNDGTILYQSPSLTKILGYKLKERIGKHFFDLIHDEDVPEMKNFFNQILTKSGITKKISYRIKDKNGSYRYFESIGYNQLQNRLIKGVIINSRDMTDRINAESKLLQSELKSAAILEAIPDLMFTIDADGTFIDYHAKRDILYEKPDFFMGKNINEILPSDISKKALECIKRTINTGKLQKFEYSLKLKGKERWFEGRFVLKGDKEVLIISREVTNAHKSNEQIKRTKEYLQKIIDNTSELIFTVGSDFKIRTWNDTATQITGIKRKQALNSDIRTFQDIENIEELVQYMKKVFRERPAMIKYINIKTRFNTKRLFRVSASIIRNNAKVITDIVFLCHDVTFMEIANSQLISGLGYLVINESSEYVNNITSGLIQDGREGLFFTRNMIKEGLEHIQHEKLHFSFYSESPDFDISGIKSLDDIYKQTSDFVKHHDHGFICINRIDYLVIRFDFKSVMNLFYEIHDLIHQHDILFLICFNEDMFTSKELALFYQEFNRLPSQKITDIYLDANLFEMLEFIYMENNINRIVTQMKICRYLSISKVTSQKRIKELLSKKLITSKNVGRANHLFITEKGKELLKHWKKP